MTKTPVSVGLLARSVVTRIHQSSLHLATEVKFKCEVCRDIGRVTVDGRSKKCINCPKREETKKKPF